LILIFLLSVLGLVSTACANDKVCLKDKCFNVKVAITAEEHKIGLQQVKVLPEDQGMLFVFEREDHHRFWMKDTFIPLDIIWLNSDKKIVHISHKVEPCKKDPCVIYVSPKMAQYVLELNAGSAESFKFGEGDLTTFRLQINNKDMDK
ncbi:MAG: uncharacterized membrane protein (UPF0127 family), partial [Lysobacterales bacterium]